MIGLRQRHGQPCSLQEATACRVFCSQCLSKLSAEEMEV